ncbi:PREDICTED: uncharacterized protein LOC106147482 [Chinchilla lanigera]|uniref:uncharacterized protein LOC106147482 n=1 Tax=Chinchilla lanigera TaxID=34839 RepID=UPI000697EEC6|nr:PREDICTED: uncharacterized protein LOC106147482 [Chinchilla lanigera]
MISHLGIHLDTHESIHHLCVSYTWYFCTCPCVSMCSSLSHAHAHTHTHLISRHVQSPPMHSSVTIHELRLLHTHKDLTHCNGLVPVPLIVLPQPCTAGFSPLVPAWEGILWIPRPITLLPPLAWAQWILRLLTLLSGAFFYLLPHQPQDLPHPQPGSWDSSEMRSSTLSSVRSLRWLCCHSQRLLSTDSGPQDTAGTDCTLDLILTQSHIAHVLPQPGPGQHTRTLPNNTVPTMAPPCPLDILHHSTRKRLLQPATLLERTPSTVPFAHSPPFHSHTSSSSSYSTVCTPTCSFSFPSEDKDFRVSPAHIAMVQSQAGPIHLH